MVATVHCRDDPRRWSFGYAKLTSDEARKIAKAISRFSEFMTQRRGFHARGPGNYRWKASRPFHVAFEDTYVRAHWDGINGLCKVNGLPFDPTGENILSDGLWCVYEFGQQLDAMMAWNCFQGRWLRGEEFSYLERLENMPTLKEVSRPAAWNEKPPTSGDEDVSKNRLGLSRTSSHKTVRHREMPRRCQGIFDAL